MKNPLLQFDDFSFFVKILKAPFTNKAKICFLSKIPTVQQIFNLITLVLNFKDIKCNKSDFYLITFDIL